MSPPTVTKVLGVDATDVSVHFGGREPVKALDHCTLQIEKGKRVAILGPSGCGKTTLLRAVGGLQATSAGRVEVLGMTADEARRKRAYMLVGQSSTLLPWRTVAANVALPAELAGIPKKQRAARAAEMIELVGLAGFESSYPYQLSGGMQQRVVVARALSMSPELILLDEPFGALDDITRSRLNTELQDMLFETKATMLLVTHSIAEAVMLSDEVYVMSPRPGRIHSRVVIDLPVPRPPGIRSSTEFLALEQQLRSDLEEAMRIQEQS